MRCLYQIPSELRELSGSGGKVEESEWMEGGHQENENLNWAKLILTARDRSSKHRASMGAHQVLCVCVIAWSSIFLWNSWVVNEWDANFLAFSWGSFPSLVLPCLALMQWFLFYLIIFYLVKNKLINKLEDLPPKKDTGHFIYNISILPTPYQGAIHLLLSSFSFTLASSVSHFYINCTMLALPGKNITFGVEAKCLDETRNE